MKTSKNCIRRNQQTVLKMACRLPKGPARESLLIRAANVRREFAACCYEELGEWSDARWESVDMRSPSEVMNDREQS